ncbi:MAG: MBL fold metallo-hydrolase [Solirubrobacteraceae bacterium]
MIFRQITHDDLGCASYLIGDEDAGIAAVVDPRLEVDEYLELARYMGVTIEHVLETHNHADHVSGHGRLAAATGARIHIHPEAGAGYEHVPVRDGEELALGALTIRALHTPGHRPEHTAYLLIDTARGREPWAVLTGDSLFVGDVARPDLAIEKAEGAREIFRSLHRQLLSLDDIVEVWPGHLGGSMCGGPGMDMKIASTIGFERRHNPVLAISDEDEFVGQVLAGLGPQPPNFEAIVAVNTGPLVIDEAEIPPLTPRQVQSHHEDDALLVDVRTDEQFDDAHIAGSVSIPMTRAGFGSKLAWLATSGQTVVVIGRDDADGAQAGRLAAAVGIDDVAGYLQGGMTSWRQEGRPAEQLQRVSVGELARWVAAGAEIQILDVRERGEWESERIPGASFVPWHDIKGVPEGIDPDSAVAVMCASGQRAATAASLLRRYGAGNVIHVVDGGVPAWAEHGQRLEHPDRRSPASS